MTKKFFFIAYILFFNYSIAEPFDIRKQQKQKDLPNLRMKLMIQI